MFPGTGRGLHRRALARKQSLLCPLPPKLCHHIPLRGLRPPHAPPSPEWKLRPTALFNQPLRGHRVISPFASDDGRLGDGPGGKFVSSGAHRRRRFPSFPRRAVLFTRTVDMLQRTNAIRRRDNAPPESSSCPPTPISAVETSPWANSSARSFEALLEPRAFVRGDFSRACLILAG